MIKLWGRANSSNVMKVIWGLEELGLSYTRTDVGGPFGGTSTPEYRTMNPLGLVPSLEEDGFTLFESNAISFEDAIRNADSANDLRLQIKLNSQRARTTDLSAGTEHFAIV